MAWALIAALLVGCATYKPRTPTLSPTFYGVWTNVNPDFYNWWVINSAGAVNYGIALSEGKCSSYVATVLAQDQLNVQFGNSGTAHLSIAENGFLLLSGDQGRALHKRVTPTEICRKPDGTYFDGAPHVGAMR